jgi:acyl-coenzyme A thioesterase PaaI-like protein
MTSVHIFSYNKSPSVSVNLVVNYAGSIKVDSDILIETEIDKIGKNLAFSKCNIYTMEKKLLYSGSHVKFFMNSKF